MDARVAEAFAPSAPAPARWLPPPFCRISWTSEASRSLWEPRLRAARDAIEDLAVLRSAGDGLPRIALVRPASVPRLTKLAERSRVALATGAAVPPGAHDVAAGRAGRVALLIGGAAPPAPSPWEDDVAEDPVWRLARETPGLRPFDDGRGLIVGGDWASNILLAPVGLAAIPLWPQSFNCADAEAEGEALLASAADHKLAEPIGHLREALSWPISWTALHGAAEVKTPVFRFIRNTPPTGARLSIRRLGAGMPETAAKGIGFPFTGKAGTGDAT